MSAFLKAFAVQETDENTGGIFFARHDIAAKKAGANEFADGDISTVSCRRAPWADAYAETKVPVTVMIANGWHFECYGCDARIDEYWLEEHNLPLDGVIGTQWSAVYCCSRCRRKHLSRRRRTEAAKQRAIDAFKAIVRKRFPDAVFVDQHDNPNWRHHAHVTCARGGGWHWQQVNVAFTFPGMQIAPATYRLDERPWVGYGGVFIGPVAARYMCCTGDRDAFEAWAKASKAVLT